MDIYNKYYLKKKSNKYITKILVSIIFFLLCIIYIKLDNNNYNNFKKIVYSDNLSFNKFNDIYNKYFGNIIPSINLDNDTTVFNEELINNTMDNYLNGKIINVDNNYIVSALNSGVVVYIGQKEGYNKTIIIQGIDGVDIWYGNVGDYTVNLYDYVKKGDLISKVNDNKLYLVLVKDNKYIDYEDYKV